MNGRTHEDDSAGFGAAVRWHTTALYVMTPLFAILMFYAFRFGLFEGMPDGFATSFYALVCATTVSLLFLSVNRAMLTEVAPAVAAGVRGALLVTILWFSMAIPTVTTLSFVGFTSGTTRTDQMNKGAEGVKIQQQKTIARASKIAEAKPAVTACQSKFAADKACEVPRGCVSGFPNKDAKARTPVADLLGRIEIMCGNAAAELGRQEDTVTTLVRELRRHHADMDRLRLNTRLSVNERRAQFHKHLAAALGAESRLDAASGTAALVSLRDGLRAIDAAGGGHLSEGLTKARAMASAEAARFDRLLGEIDTSPVDPFVFDEGSTLTAAFAQFDRTWLHFVAALCVEGGPFALFGLAVATALGRRKDSGGSGGTRNGGDPRVVSPAFGPRPAE